MNLIKLKFLRDGQPSGREYTYISKSAVEVGDTVQVREAEEGKDAPKGIVTAINVPESEVESFKDRLKEIVGKVDNYLPEGVKIEPKFVGGKIESFSYVRESEVEKHE